MTLQEVIDALQRVQDEFEKKTEYNKDSEPISTQKTKGGYFRVGNIAIKIAEITELT